MVVADFFAAGADREQAAESLKFGKRLLQFVDEFEPVTLGDFLCGYGKGEMVMDKILVPYSSSGNEPVFPERIQSIRFLYMSIRCREA